MAHQNKTKKFGLTSSHKFERKVLRFKDCIFFSVVYIELRADVICQDMFTELLQIICSPLFE